MGKVLWRKLPWSSVPLLALAKGWRGQIWTNLLGKTYNWLSQQFIPNSRVADKGDVKLNSTKWKNSKKRVAVKIFTLNCNSMGTKIFGGIKLGDCRYIAIRGGGVDIFTHAGRKFHLQDVCSSKILSMHSHTGEVKGGNAQIWRRPCREIREEWEDWDWCQSDLGLSSIDFFWRHWLSDHILFQNFHQTLWIFTLNINWKFSNQRPHALLFQIRIFCFYRFCQHEIKLAKSSQLFWKKMQTRQHLS